MRNSIHASLDVDFVQASWGKGLWSGMYACKTADWVPVLCAESRVVVEQAGILLIG